MEPTTLLVGIASGYPEPIHPFHYVRLSIGIANRAAPRLQLYLRKRIHCWIVIIADVFEENAILIYGTSIKCI